MTGRSKPSVLAVGVLTGGPRRCSLGSWRWIPPGPQIVSARTAHPGLMVPDHGQECMPSGGEQVEPAPHTTPISLPSPVPSCGRDRRDPAQQPPSSRASTPSTGTERGVELLRLPDPRPAYDRRRHLQCLRRRHLSRPRTGCAAHPAPPHRHGRRHQAPHRPASAVRHVCGGGDQCLARSSGPALVTCCRVVSFRTPPRTGASQTEGKQTGTGAVPMAGSRDFCPTPFRRVPPRRPPARPGRREERRAGAPFERTARPRGNWMLFKILKPHRLVFQNPPLASATRTSATSTECGDQRASGRAR